MKNRQFYFYHGTDLKGIIGIIQDRYIGTEYFDGWGCYVTDDIHTAHNHGQYIVSFVVDDPKIFNQDGVNDGFYHKGKLFLPKKTAITVIPNDQRVLNDIILNASDILKSINE
jgi:hypothetical protein